MATVKLDPAKGVQIPNLTTTERNAISSPETGALIWNTTTSAINQYNGSAWEITYTDTNTQVAGITSSANATAITIDSSENVGIGESSPARFLHVKDPTGGNIVAFFESTDANGSLSIGDNSGSVNVESIAGAMVLNVNGNTSNGGGLTEAMRINSAGIVTKPLQPAFSSYANTQNNMGLNAWLQIAFANQRFDQNQDYASNTFVAPVTGKYQLQISVRLDNLDTNTQYYQVRIRTSNRNYHSICDFDGMSTDPSYWNFNNAILADMDANDTCVIEFLQAGGNSQTDINDESYFNGYLVC